MPRSNPVRRLRSEANVATRIAHERRARNLSYEGLAQLMTEAGCPVQGSAIYRIEKGSPPRRVTVDELVALGSVLDLSVDELLTPMDVIQQRRARELIDEVPKATELFMHAVARMFRVHAEFFALAVTDPEMHDYVRHHLQAQLAELTAKPIDVLLADLQEVKADMHPYSDIIESAFTAVTAAAEDFVGTHQLQKAST